MSLVRCSLNSSNHFFLLSEFACENHRESCSDSTKCACEYHDPETLDNIDKDINKERIRRKESPPEDTPSNVKKLGHERLQITDHLLMVF
jgi:hypothetical protein